MQRTFASKNTAAMLPSAGGSMQGQPNNGGIFKNFVMSAPVTRAPSVAPKRPLEPADDSSPSSNATLTDGVCSQPTRLPSIADFDGTHSLPNTGQKSLHLRWHLVSNPRPSRISHETAATPPKLETMQGKFKLAPKPPVPPAEGDDISPLNLLSISSMMVSHSHTPDDDAQHIQAQYEELLPGGEATRTPPTRRLFPKMGSTFAKTPSFDSLAHLTPQSDPGSRAPPNSTKSSRSKPSHVTFSPPKQPMAKRPSSTGVSQPTPKMP